MAVLKIAVTKNEENSKGTKLSKQKKKTEGSATIRAVNSKKGSTAENFNPPVNP